MSGRKRTTRRILSKDNKIMKKDTNHLSDPVIEEEVVSNFFRNESTVHSNNDIMSSVDIPTQLLSCFKDLNNKINSMSFSKPVKYIYNPTDYAYDTFKNYISTYGNGHKDILFLGINPGPWGMSQTGVPFGEINAVRDWLKITGKIGKPAIESPDRPIQGFACTRSEVSGKRFWALAKHLCDTPENFFKYSFVYNYCPLQFISDGGKNVTPDDLKIQERESLSDICDVTLLETMKILNTKVAIGIGLFAEKRINTVLKKHNVENIQVYSIPHPSPRASGNTNWQEKTIARLNTLKLMKYFAK